MRAEQRVAAHGVLRTPDGVVALVQVAAGRANAGRWELPGALVRHGEHPRHTVVRGVGEQLGIDVEASGVRDAVADVVDLPRLDISLHTVRLVYDLSAGPDWPAQLAAKDDGVGSFGSGSGSAAAVPAQALAGYDLDEFTARALGLVSEGDGRIEHRPPIRPVDARPVDTRPVDGQADGGPPRVQRVGAYALVPDAGRLLLTRYAGSGRWSLPGGGIDHGEQPREALYRELHEETGFTLYEARLVDVDSVHFTGHAPDGALEDFHAIRIVYRGAVRSDAEPTVVEVDGSSDAAAWIPVDQLDRYPVTGFVGVALRLLP